MMRNKSLSLGTAPALLALLLVATLPAAAEEEFFQPKPPMPEKFGWSFSWGLISDGVAALGCVKISPCIPGPGHANFSRCC